MTSTRKVTEQKKTEVEVEYFFPEMKFQWLSVKSLRIDREHYQRVMVQNHVSNISKKWKGEAFGVVHVGRRADGTFWIVDGQQRYEAAKRLGIMKVPCLVFESRGLEHEAEIFDILNCGRRKLTPTQEYFAKLTASHPLAVGIRKALDCFNFVIPRDKSSSKRWGEFTCPTALMLCVKKPEGLKTLSWVLNCINKYWKGQEQACNEIFVGGLERFYIAYKDVFDEKRLEKVLTNGMSDAELLCMEAKKRHAKAKL